MIHLLILGNETWKLFLLFNYELDRYNSFVVGVLLVFIYAGMI
jgi:hypothetical protein